MKLPLRAFQWDLARQTERLDWLLAQLPRYAAWGYQELYLHLEDAVEYPSVPGVARRGAYSYRELGRLVTAAGASGIKVVPIVNLLGHTQYLLNVPELRELNELRAPDGSPLPQGQISPLHPRTLEIARKLLRDVAPFCTAGVVHVGLDESYHLGKHPRSRAEIAAVGLAGHFARYVHRLHGLAAAQGLRLGLWADMLALLPGAVALLPRDVVAYDWYYYPFARRPRIELRNFAAYDLAPALRARGIDYWGCPMDGSFRHEPLPIVRERLANIVSWWRRCRQTGAAGMLVTSWEPQRLAAELPQLVDAAAAGLWLDGEEDVDRLLARGARRMFGAKGPRVARALRAADAHPFSGYARWQVNERWDTVLTPEPLRPWLGEARMWGRLAAQTGLPPAVQASFRFRDYLAKRDLFVRESGQAVWQIRTALAAGDKAKACALLGEKLACAAEFEKGLTRGLAAARAMWKRTRDPRIRGDNELLLAADAGRLRAWRTWLKRCRARPSVAHTASPLAGAWQLLVRVRNFAPAAQKIVVEQQLPDGSWQDLHGLFLIEFQAAAAQPAADRLHWISVPLPGPGGPGTFPPLRLAARGFGPVAIEGMLLTDGGRHLLAGRTQTVTLGRAAPARGYPDFDWKKNRATLAVVPGLRPRSGARSS
jgi:Glycosyl hydrolase family 20, catalytic domain